MMKKKRTEEIITETIDSMGTEMRRAVIGYYFNNLSVPELSEASGLKQYEVYSLIKKGRELIRKEIQLIHGEKELFNDHRYLYTEIFLSCSEEAVEMGGMV